MGFLKHLSLEMCIQHHRQFWEIKKTVYLTKTIGTRLCKKLMFWLQFVIQISKDLVYWVNKLSCNFDATKDCLTIGVQITQHQIYKSCIFPISNQNEKAMIFTLCTKLCSLVSVYTLSETVSFLAIASRVCIELYSMFS